MCGQDVSRCSPLFANRVPDLNDCETRVEMGRKYPQGEWICIGCDNTDSDGIVHNLEDIDFSTKSSQSMLRLATIFLRTPQI